MPCTCVENSTINLDYACSGASKSTCLTGIGADLSGFLLSAKNNISSLLKRNI